MIPPQIDDDSGWLLFHSVGRFPGQRKAIGDALAVFADAWCAPDDRRWEIVDRGRKRALDLWGGLVGAPPGSVAAAENVTSAFSTFIQALPREKLTGRRVLIAEDCFPSLHFLLTGLAPHLGFRLDTVPIAPGRPYVEDEDFLAGWDADVAVAVVTWVTSTASKRADLHRLVAHGRRMGSLIAVDVTQGIGVLPFDVTAPAVDFAAATCLKWLCGVPGAGMAYVAPRLTAGLQPPLRGWFSQPNPFNWALDRFSFAPDARRFDNGTPSYLPFIGSVPGLEWLLATGVGTVSARNRAMSEQVIRIADQHRLELASPRDARARGGTVVAVLPRGNDPDEARRALLSAGLVCDVRGDRMRWSPGMVTTPAALDRLDDALGAVLARAR